LYTVPTHQNPTGKTLAIDRRKKLVELSKKYNFLVLADEVYQLIHHQNYQPPSPMVNFDSDEDGTVIGLGSFAKILAPGVRLGWIQCKNTDIMNRLANSGELLSGGNANLVPNIVQSMIELGLQHEQLELYNKQYEERTLTGIAWLNHYFHKNSKLPLIIPSYLKGGYFVWVETQDPSIDTFHLLEKCKPFNVAFQVGTFSSNSKKFKNCMRFCFVHWSVSQIEGGIRNMAKALL